VQEADHEAASHEHDFWVAKRAVELLWGMRGNESTGHLRYSGSAQPTDAAAFDRSQTPNLNWSTPCCLEGAAVTRKKPTTSACHSPKPHHDLATTSSMKADLWQQGEEMGKEFRAWLEVDETPLAGEQIAYGREIWWPANCGLRCPHLY
jgi:hypothetical protein